MRDKDVNIPKTAIIGASGLLGRYFLSAYRLAYPDCVGTVKEHSGKNQGIYPLDLYAPDISQLRLAKKRHKEALILAGVTKFNLCEKEKIAARRANVDGTLELVRQLIEEGVKPVFFSSSYVFDGKTGGYTDESPVNPLTEYGRQKAEVETKIADITKGNFLIARLGKVFSLAREDNTMLDEIAFILSSGGVYQAAFDQIFSPTFITDVIDAVSLFQAGGTTGIVHICPPDARSRYDLAIALARAMGVSTDKVKRVSLDEIMPGQKYPKNISLAPSAALKLHSVFTPMSVCIDRAARNWTGREKATSKYRLGRL